jgi:hypothetical protein
MIAKLDGAFSTGGFSTIFTISYNRGLPSTALHLEHAVG